DPARVRREGWLLPSTSGFRQVRLADTVPGTLYGTAAPSVPYPAGAWECLPDTVRNPALSVRAARRLSCPDSGLCSHTTEPCCPSVARSRQPFRPRASSPTASGGQRAWPTSSEAQAVRRQRPAPAEAAMTAAPHGGPCPTADRARAQGPRSANSRSAPAAAAAQNPHPLAIEGA